MAKDQYQIFIHLIYFVEIQMGNICPCLKRDRKKDFVYDVHEETFDMEDKIQNAVSQQFSKSEPHSDRDSNNNNILPEDLRNSQENIDAPQVEDQKQVEKLIEQRIPTEQQQKSSDIIANSITPLSDAKVQEKPNIPQDIENQKPAQEKPKFHANILKPKITKKKYNPQDYRFANQTGAFKVKKIGSIKQQQFNIQNCRDSHFFVFDMTANVYIDDCENCVIFIAPCDSTIFVRNCKRLTIIVATKQFRTYQCHDCLFSLYCKSQPVIESSSNLKFSSFQGPMYQQLAKQFQKMHLQIWNNHWSQIHNFTKKQGQNHFELFQHAIFSQEINWAKAGEDSELELNISQNYVPFIIGDLAYQVKNEIIILVNKQVSDDQIKTVIKDCVILKGFQEILKGEGKDERKVLLLDTLSNTQNFQKFQSIGKLYTDHKEIQKLKEKWFVCFKDSRQQQQ